MKILFLDIDGVLVHRHSGCEPGSTMLTLWDQTCANRIIEICNRTGALIVVQSTWGWLHSESEMREFFRAYHFPNDILHPHLLANAHKGHKPASIKAWLKLHKGLVSKCVNVDDDTEDYGVPSVIIRGGFMLGGIKPHHVEEVVKILGEKNEGTN